MYCSNCGTKLENEDLFCSKCGQKKISENIEETKEEVIDNNPNPNYSNQVLQPEKNNGNKTASIILGVISIVGALLVIFSPIAFILSIIGLILGIIANKKVKNPAGIILNSIGLAISFATLILLIFFGIMVYNIIESEETYNENYYHEYYDELYDQYQHYSSNF